MNWQTEELIEVAKDVISDHGVFSPDQIYLLSVMIDKISEAIETEIECSKQNC